MTLRRNRVVESCDFCAELSRQPSFFKETYAEYDRTLLERSHFVVLPSMGHMVSGYTLILSRRHVTSVSHLSGEELRQMSEIMSRLSSALQAAYGKKPMFFEHGVPSGDRSDGGCGIYHLHVHAVPLESDRRIIARLAADLSLEPLRSLDDLATRAPSEPYLLVVGQDGEARVALSRRLPSQYMRRLLGMEWGVEWDWRKAGREPLLLETLEVLRSQLMEPANG